MTAANRPCAEVVRKAAKAVGVEYPILKVTSTRTRVYIEVSAAHPRAAAQIAEALYPLWDDGHRRVQHSPTCVTVGRVDYHMHPPALGADVLRGVK